MRFWAILLTSCWASASAGAALAEAPAHYVGVGVRAGLNDPTAAAINAKVKLTTMGDLSLSVRPELFIGSSVEGRLPLTVEGSLMEGLNPYAGAGLAYNTDGTHAVDPMVTAGLDLGVGHNLVLDLELNVIFQTTASDTDTELVGSLNYAF